MSNDTRQDSERTELKPSDEDTIRAERREFLRKAGRFAVYTPPAMMLLMKPSRNAVAGSALGKGNGSTGAESSVTATDVRQAIY